MRHVDWMRTRVTPTSDPEIAAALIPQARLLLGQMMDGLQLVGQRTGVLRRELPDGSTITVSFDGTTPTVEIDTPAGETQEVTGELYNMWVPRGFVVYPAWSDMPYGVGLPIVQDTTAGSQDATNLAPGLDRARWTPGGPCGEVLVSADESAGYPRAVDTPVPLLYHPTKGPVFRYTGRTVLDARVLAGPWQPYRLELAPFGSVEQGANPGEQRTLLELANAARVAAGQPAATQRLRGFGRPAEIMASIMDAAGSAAETAEAYPPTYKTPADRLTKDGYPADWTLAALTSFTRADIYGAHELRATNGSAGAVAGWQADPTANALLIGDYGAGLVADTGAVNGYRALALMSRDRWIAAGNMSWQSADVRLPPLSWHGFASLNLAWETYPATYDRTNRATAPLVPLYAFTSAQGDPWLNYPRNPAPHSYDLEPALGRHVYSRGRAIALAPDGALVWGACTQRVVRADASIVDRLILLAHHPADQASDYTHQGWTRYLRVWWADVPPRTLDLDPQQVICGTDATDPLSWRGGEMIDVGHMPAPSTGGNVGPGVVSSLKLASQWRFSPDGSKAVCLRDFGLYTDYSSLTTVDGLESHNGMQPRAVELTFTAGIDSLTTTVVFHDFTAGVTTPPRYAVYGDHGETEYPVTPIAVDYDRDGGLLYAFIASRQWGSLSNSWVTTYAGVGRASAQWVADLANVVTVGSDRASDGVNFAPVSVGTLVADVRRGAFVVDGMRPRVLYADAGGGGTANPDYASCWPFTTALVHGMRMFLDGALVDEHWYPVPDGAVIAPEMACNVHEAGSSAAQVYLPLAAPTQVHWAERFGQYVFTAQCSPVPLTVRVRDNAIPDGLCDCTVSAWDIADRSHWMTFADLNPRGGHAVASVPLPANDWLIYAKVV